MAEKPKRKQKSKQKLTDKAQSERFKKTARKLGAEESQDFAEIIKRLAPNKRA
jgi:hypothetical protein